MLWLRWLVTNLSMQRPELNTRPSHVGIMDKVGQRQDFLQVLLCFPVSSSPPVLHTYSFITHTI